ncbi:hypothetical protein [Halobacteriovorax sp. JY17]|uniref:hypothetical protein n=1 Tax=Halobacteriovorax sp. JY17 TaxID=2014617 RepID=UPI000C41BA92|nr:hypothetical protein [Halobacteriovorax sp. JY17]PIK15009.1 MAG: hypothetical protein CES88_11795 [Halobacteriovorax sp. JY17]
MIFDDMNPKRVEAIQSYLENKKVLIAETKKTTRTTLKKILSTFGIKVQHIFIADNNSDACEIINDLKIDIVFAGFEVQDQKGIDILKTHLNIFPNRQDAIFSLISGPNSIASSCLILDTEADDYIAEPFTAKSIAESLLKTIERKMNATPFIKSYHSIKEAIFLNDLERAKKELAPLAEGFDNLDEIFYLDARIHQEEGNLEEALKLYEQSLEVNHAHYHSLKALAEEYSNIKMWKKAYTHTIKLLKHYPINPDNLPSLIRLSIANHQYEDLIKYAEFFRSLEVQSPSIKTNIAASLVICSKFFLRNGERQKGIKTLLEAVKCSSGKLSILENIISTFIEHKEVKLGFEVLRQFESLHGENPLYKSLEIEIDYCNKDINSVLKKGIPLAESGVANIKVYEAVILSSIKAQRKTNSIIHLIDKAVAKFPDSSKHFQSMFKE